MKNIRAVVLSAAIIFSPGAFAETHDSGYVGLLSRITTVVKESGKVIRTVDIKNRVTTADGATRQSNQIVQTRDPSVRFKLLKAEVKTDGRIFVTRPSEVRQTVHSLGTYGIVEERKQLIPLNRVKVGSEITLSYQLEQDPLVSGVFSDVAGISNREFAEDESQIYVSDLPLKFISRGIESFYSVKESRENGKFKLVIAPLPSARQLVGKEEKPAMVFVSSAKSWRQINVVISTKYESVLSKALPPEFARIVREAKELKDAKAQIELVSRHLQTLITYSGDWSNVDGRYYPTDFKTLVNRGKGDCKDYSTSLVGLLRALGFEAHVAFSFRRQAGLHFQSLLSEMPKAASLAYFNHAIVWAKDATGKEWWVDPTNPIVIANVLSSDLLGNLALVLNAKDDTLQGLPARNSEPESLSVRQTVTTRPDNSVDVKATIAMNAPIYNSLTMIERRFGSKVMQSALGALLNPLSKTKVDYRTQVDQERFEYSVALQASDWVNEERGKRTEILIRHPSLLLMMKPGGEDEWDFGSQANVEYVTVLKGRNVVDPIEHECIGRSKWVDFDREVVLVGSDTEIRDRVTIKERFVAPKEFKGDDFTSLRSEVYRCLGASQLIVSMDPSQRTLEQARLDQFKGPPIEKMMEPDFEALAANSTNLHLRSYALRKMYRFNLYKIRQNPGDLVRYGSAARNLIQLGFLRGDDYLPGFLAAALKVIEDGEKAANGKFNLKLHATKVSLAAISNRLADANRDFAIVYANEPNSFETHFLGYVLNDKAKKHDDAMKWLNSAIKLAAKPEDKKRAMSTMASALSEQNRHEDAIKQFAEILKDKDATAWDWHNAAREYWFSKQWDKCIEFERKALSIADFGVARDLLASALHSKGTELAIKGGSESDVEGIYLEALKWDKNHVLALVALVELHKTKYLRTKDVEELAKSKVYLERAVAVGPEKPEVRFAIFNFERAMRSRDAVAEPLAPATNRAPAGKQ